MANFFFSFFFFSIFSTCHTKLSRFHKSYCTEVLQSANIMNWHKLVYTFHFLDDLKESKSTSLTPIRAGQCPLTLIAVTAARNVYLR